MRAAIDTGGTFTDCVYLEAGQLRVLKLFSTPSDPSLAVLDALEQIADDGEVDLRHGTTLGTNAMLERRGARVAFVTTAGFEDTIAIGRQTRSALYDWFAPVPVCLVPRELRFGVLERVSAEGEILCSPDDAELRTLADAVRDSGAEAAAISLLFSFANPETERRVEAALAGLEIPVSVSHRILPEFREYERASTTVVNAYLAPLMESYLRHLEERVAAQHRGGRVDVMQSSGGIVSAKLAAQEPVRTVLSGPAGGVIGATRVAEWAGFSRIIGFDMGGTSTDVFLADAAHGGVRRTREAVVAGVPVSVPMLEIHTAGAGGGSLARFDAGGEIDLRDQWPFLLAHQRFRPLAVQRYSPAKKAFRIEPPQQKIRIGHGCICAASETNRTWIGSRRLRSDAQHAAGIVARQGSATGARGMDLEHGHAHRHSCDNGFAGAAHTATRRVGEKNIGRRAAHIEADDALETRPPGHACRADHAARRSGKDRAHRFARRDPCGHDAAGGLHHVDAAASVLCSHALFEVHEIAFHARRKICVDDSG